MPFLREEVLSALFLTLMFLGTPEVLLKRSKKKQSLQAKSEKMIVFLLSLLRENPSILSAIALIYFKFDATRFQLTTLLYQF